MLCESFGTTKNKNKTTELIKYSFKAVNDWSTPSDHMIVSHVIFL